MDFNPSVDAYGEFMGDVLGAAAPILGPIGSAKRIERMQDARDLERVLEINSSSRSADRVGGVSKNHSPTKYLRNIDELLVDGKVPTGKNFNSWFDEMSPDEFESLWNSKSKIGDLPD